MVGLLRLLLVLWPIAELIVLIAVAQWVGIGWTVLALLAGAIAGIAVIRVLGAASLSELHTAVMRREPPAGALLRGACVLVAGMLLILPGFIGDVLAVLLLMPGLRRVVLGAFLGALWRGARRSAGGSTIIEADYQEVRVEPRERRIVDHPSGQPPGRPPGHEP